MDKLLRKMQKSIRRITFCVSLLFLNHASLFASITTPVEATLKQLSYEEKFFLKTLFCSFLKNDSLGHVLFCTTKPACLAAIDKRCHQKSYRQKILLKGWKCWKNHEHLFQHPNFIFLEEECAFGDEKVLHIFIINKEVLFATLTGNIEFFKATLGSDFSPENFMVSIEKERVLRPLIKNDEALLGLILGYGLESSIAFKQAHEKIDYSGKGAPKWTENYTGIEAIYPKKCKIHPIAFIGNPQSREVLSLLECYNRESKEIWKIYRSSPNFLEAVLKRLCDE